jgi:hypothetical protein
MKAAYLWIIFIFIAGVAISLYLIPSKEELAFLKLKSQNPSQAEEFYQEQYNKGVRTPSIVYELSIIYERQGKLDQAIKVIKEYSDTHPEDADVLTRLADLYYLNHQFKEFDQTLVKMRQMKAKIDPDYLRELKEFYKSQHNVQQQESLLNEIIQTGKADEGDYAELSILYAQEKQFEKAASLLKTRRIYFDEKNTPDMILFELWVNDKIGKAQSQEAVRTVADYLKKKKDPLLTLHTLEQFKESYPSLAPQLIQLMQSEIKKNPRLEGVALSIMWDHPDQREKVFRKLLRLEKFSKDDPQLQNFLFNIYLERDNDEHLLHLIQNTPMQKIDERAFIDFSLTARNSEKTRWAIEMQKALGQKYLEEHPLRALSLSIAAQQNEARVKFNQYVKEHSLTPSEKYNLFRLAVAAKWNQEALELGATLPPYTGLKESDLVEIAQAYASMKKAEILYPLFEKELPTMGNKNADAALTLLDIALHRTKKAADWIEQQKTIKENILKAYFETAKESQEYALDLLIAKRLLKDYPSRSAQSSYALALVQVGIIEKGIALLKDLYYKTPLNPQIQRDYFSALIVAVKKDKSYKHDLLAFMQNKERQGHLSTELRREFAYIYLETFHDFHKAQALFLTLAEETPANREDIQTLIYLWGPHVSQEQTLWVEQHAEKADGEELAYWLENLNFIGDFKATICIFRKRAKDCLYFKAYFAYMQALAYEKLKNELQRTVEIVFLMVQERKQLEELAVYAEEGEHPEARIWIWERIVADHPEDPLAWQALAKAQYDARAYCQAGGSLEAFFELNQEKNSKLYESFYEYAEVLRKRHDYIGSSHYYCLAMRQIADAEEQTPRMKEIAALSYYQLYMFGECLQDIAAAFNVSLPGCMPVPEKLFLGTLIKIDSLKSLRYMNEYFVMSGRDPNAAAGFANMLMDYGWLSTAENYLYNIKFYSPEKFEILCEESSDKKIRQSFRLQCEGESPPGHCPGLLHLQSFGLKPPQTACYQPVRLLQLGLKHPRTACYQPVRLTVQQQPVGLKSLQTACYQPERLKVQQPRATPWERFTLPSQSERLQEKTFPRSYAQ